MNPQLIVFLEQELALVGPPLLAALEQWIAGHRAAPPTVAQQEAALTEAVDAEAEAELRK